MILCHQSEQSRSLNEQSFKALIVKYEIDFNHFILYGCDIIRIELWLIYNMKIMPCIQVLDKSCIN